MMVVEHAKVVASTYRYVRIQFVVVVAFFIIFLLLLGGISAGIVYIVPYVSELEQLVSKVTSMIESVDDIQKFVPCAQAICSALG